MASRTHNEQWMSCYKGQTFIGGADALIGDPADYQSLFGYPEYPIMDDVNSSSTSAKVYVHIYVENPGLIDVGMHKLSSRRTADGLPYYKYVGLSWQNPNNGWNKYDITNEVKANFPTFKGLVFYQSATTNNRAVVRNNSYIEVVGDWQAGIWVNDHGNWKKGKVWVNDHGNWKQAKQVWVNDHGTWKTAK